MPRDWSSYNDALVKEAYFIISKDILDSLKMFDIDIKDEVYWLWIVYEPYTKKYLLMNISKERTLLVCYNFIKRLKKLYGSRYTIYTDGAHYYNQACKWLRIKHIVYDSNGKNIMDSYTVY
jgi:transposase-like protein